jgi:hypothetical protein
MAALAANNVQTAAAADDATPLPTSVLRAKIAAPDGYRFALAQGAQLRPTADDRSFYLLWMPPGKRPSDTPIIVTLHGEERWAFEEFSLWHEAATNHGFGILAIQWWFGDGPRDYYRPQELFPVVAGILQSQSTKPGQALLHGFGRGAANTYALAFLDRRTKSGFFGLVVADSGGVPLAEAGGLARKNAAETLPLYSEILRGRHGTNAFAGTHWVLFTGGLKSSPEVSGASAMRKTSGWLTELGGTVELFIEEPRAEQEGLHRHPEHLETALRLFEKRPRSRPAAALKK